MQALHVDAPVRIPCWYQAQKSRPPCGCYEWSSHSEPPCCIIQMLTRELIPRLLSVYFHCMLTARRPQVHHSWPLNNQFHPPCPTLRGYQ